MIDAFGTDMLRTMKRAAAVLRESERDFALAGGMAAWAAGGPMSEHDIDFYVRQQDIDAVVEQFGSGLVRPGETF